MEHSPNPSQPSTEPQTSPHSAPSIDFVPLRHGACRFRKHGRGARITRRIDGFIGANVCGLLSEDDIRSSRRRFGSRYRPCPSRHATNVNRSSSSWQEAFPTASAFEPILRFAERSAAWLFRQCHEKFLVVALNKVRTETGIRANSETCYPRPSSNRGGSLTCKPDP